jgi:hypothetical protein
MEKNIIVYRYQNEHVESIKKVLRKELVDYATIQALHDGQRKEQITENEFRSLGIGPVETRTQLAMDEIKKVLNVAEKITNTKQAEADALVRADQVQKEINLLAHQRNSQVREKESLPLCRSKSNLVLWLGIIALVLGVIEGGISYESFKVAFPFSQALLMAVATGFVVGVSHPFGDWAAKAKTSMLRNRRIISILSAAAVFFAFFAFLRANAAASFVSVTVDGDNSTPPNLFLNAISFFIISLLLFTSGLFLAIIFYKSTTEKENEQKHAAIDKAIAQLDNKLATLKKELKELPEKVTAQKEEARILFYYLEQSIQECKSIANAAIAEYKKSFAQQRDIVPDFFTSPVLLNYYESISNHNNKTFNE